MRKVLIMEDEENIRSFVVINLKRAGYQAVEAATGQEALDKLRENPDIGVAILDIMLPDIDGFEVCRRIRATNKQMGIIMLTARTQEMDKVTGLMTGADDYVTKPFPMSVFQKKVSALLARIRKQSGGDCYNDGNLFINFSEMSATQGGESISFTPMEYRLLKVLTKNPQIVLTRQVLLEKLWDIDGNFVDEHALTSTISRVRNKIENPDHAYIKTVYGMGYMWIGGGNK